MNDQLSFVEPLKRARRKRTKPQKLAEKFRDLADWYRVNKPDVKILRISKDDAWSLRGSWLENEVECRQNGFNCMKSTPNLVTSMSYHNFDLVETA